MTHTEPLARRDFLRRAAYGLAAAPFVSLLGCTSSRSVRVGTEVLEANDTPFDLAPGLTAVVLGRTGEPMTDGYITPSRPDGMACFADADGRWVLMRNHEIRGDEDPGPYDLDDAPPQAYQSGELGGVTRVVVDPVDLSIIESNVVLTGTRRNCAGGPTPLGWLSCEEALDDDGTHGFVFLCDPNAASVQPPRRIDAYGRFVHEAAGFDPSTGICYLTEDRPESCLYRFVPFDPLDPFGDGTLQALRVLQEDRYDTGAMAVDDRVSIGWIDVPDPLAGARMPAQNHDLGAAVVVRGEGCWYDDGRLVFAATSGGAEGNGQIFELREPAPGAAAGTESTLRCIAVGDADDSLKGPDNVTIAPDGSIYFAEDNGSECLIQCIATDGTIRAIARNVERDEEIAGLCFSPDGSVLFANIQEPGITLAITGL